MYYDTLQFDQTRQTTAYKLSSLKMAKRLWKIAVEHHAFFRSADSISHISALHSDTLPCTSYTQYWFQNHITIIGRYTSLKNESIQRVQTFAKVNVGPNSQTILGQS